nr:phosphotransferase [Chloroflexota bacterium]
GYDFLVITDHFMEHYGFAVTDSREFRDESFTTLLGAELHGPSLTNGGLWHIVAAGLPLDFASQRQEESGPEIAARAAATGAFIGLAHPAWNGVTPSDALSVKSAHAIEIHNEGHTNDSDRGDGWYLADLLATAGWRFSVFAADDAHFGERADRFGGWVMVRAQSLEPDALVAALKAGHFYSSTGPTIEAITIDRERIRIACSPAARILLGGRGSTCRWLHGEDLTHASFPLGPFAGAFCRVTIVDAAGKRAWSNPIWLEEAMLG